MPIVRLRLLKADQQLVPAGTEYLPERKFGMSTISCGDCGRPISDTERTCPYCGFPVSMSINIMLSNKSQQSGTNTRGSHNPSRHVRTITNKNRGRAKSSSVSHGKTYYSKQASKRGRVRYGSKRSNSKKYLVYAAALLILLLVIAGIIFGIKHCGAGKGSVASPVSDSSGYTYYAYSKDSNRLYRLDENDEEAVPEKLSEHIPGELLLDGDWLYFTSTDDNNAIYRVSTDGSEETKMVDASARNLFIESGWLVYEDKDQDYEQFKIPIGDVSVSSTKPAENEDHADSDGADDGNTDQNAPDSDSKAEDSGNDGSSAETTPGTMKVNNSKLPWNLVLANSNNILSESYDDKVTLGFMVSGKKVDKRITSKLAEMLTAMRDEMSRCDITPTSSYRSVKVQKTYFERAVQKQLDAGLSQEEAEEKASENVARPGASDHNTGLAVEFNDGAKSFGESKEYKWLKKNAHIYGFIERYPENKKDVTGYTWEPYHFRYVGEEAAAVIHDEGICLEEYIFEHKSNCIK